MSILVFPVRYRAATVRIREKIKGTDSLTVVVRNGASC
jgi:hypothetical protein